MTEQNGQADATIRPLRDVVVPLTVDRWIVMRGRFPLTEAEWTQLQGVLDAMRPGLVTP